MYVCKEEMMHEGGPHLCSLRKCFMEVILQKEKWLYLRLCYTVWTTDLRFEFIFAALF